MTTKDYLRTVSRMNRAIENKSEEIKHLHDLAIRITSGTSGDKVQENGSHDRLGDTVACIYDLENELHAIVEDAIRQRKVIAGQIEEIDEDTYCNILYKRYVLGKKFKDISEEMDYNMEHLFRLHRKALKTFEKKFGKEYAEKML